MASDRAVQAAQSGNDRLILADARRSLATAMHSARELSGTADAEAMTAAMTAFLRPA